MAAVGAFLLVAAAGVFVAVRWNRLTANGRLALVVAVTGGCLAGGRWLRRTLPSTGDVLFHLGAFLLPIDLAAAVLQGGLRWRDLLLAEGLLAAGALGGLGLVTGSVVLRGAGIAGVVVLAAGVAGFTPLSAAVVLAAIAVGTELGGRCRWRAPLRSGPAGRPLRSGHAGPPLRSGHAGRAPVVWAAVAGLAPLLGAAASLVAGSLGDRLGAGTLADLGLSGPASVGGAPVAGVCAALVLARRARRDNDLLLAFGAMASMLVAAGTTVLTPDLPPEVRAVGIAAAFALVELVAFALLHDPFWARPLHLLAIGAECVVGGVAAVLAGIVVLGAPYAGLTDLTPDGVTAFGPAASDRVLAATLAICALAWLAADQRRYRGTPRPLGLALVRGGKWALGAPAVALNAVAAVELATYSGPATTAALLAVAALAVVARRPGTEAIAAAAGPWAVLCVLTSPVAGALAGVAGAGVTAFAAVRRVAEEERPGASVLVALSAITTVGLGAGAVSPSLPPTVAVAGTAVGLWLLAVLLDRGRESLGDLARAAVLVPVGAGLLFAPRSTLLGVAVAAVLLVFDAVRMDRPEVGCGAALAVQAVVFEVALGAGLTVAGVGLALCVGAVAWSGLAVVVDERWRLPFLVAAGTGVWTGVLLASGDAAYLSSALLVSGTLLGSAGLYAARPVATHAGGAVVCLGLAGHLGVAGVDLPEAYLAPVAAQLAFAGWQARRSWPLSSWVAYGPAVALLGGVALAERLTGGGGLHAVIAGAVGVGGVAAGGWRRLLAPLFLGTVIVVVLALHESLSALAGVPTWAWLGTAGAVLLSVGIALERSDSTPTEVGRRLVDVLAERYG